MATNDISNRSSMLVDDVELQFWIVFRVTNIVAILENGTLKIYATLYRCTPKHILFRTVPDASQSSYFLNLHIFTGYRLGTALSNLY